MPPIPGTIRLGFIGAGGVNFGTTEGNWNHAQRLEAIEGLQFVAVVDIDLALAQRRIEERKAPGHPAAAAWSTARAFKDYKEMLSHPEACPDAVIIGLPPAFHGSADDPTADVELQLARRGIHMFVEKPLSVRPADEVERLSRELAQLSEEKGIVVAVGYMLRYLAVVRGAVRVLREIGLPPLMVNARYASAYSEIKKTDWWDTSRSGGPIVEQATHFIDLMRHLAGDIERDSISALALGPEKPLSDMAAPPFGEHQVPVERRINRATAAVFRFSSGAIGSLTHSALAHGSAFHTQIEVTGDGVQLLLQDLYHSPRLLLRRPHEDGYSEVNCSAEAGDMYTLELQAFLHAVRTGDCSRVLSPYADAAKTYEASQWITAASKKPGK